MRDRLSHRGFSHEAKCANVVREDQLFGREGVWSTRRGRPPAERGDLDIVVDIAGSSTVDSPAVHAGNGNVAPATTPNRIAGLRGAWSLHSPLPMRALPLLALLAGC